MTMDWYNWKWSRKAYNHPHNGEEESNAMGKILPSLLGMAAGKSTSSEQHTKYSTWTLPRVIGTTTTIKIFIGLKLYLAIHTINMFSSSQTCLHIKKNFHLWFEAVVQLVVLTAWCAVAYQRSICDPCLGSDVSGVAIMIKFF